MVLMNRSKAHTFDRSISGSDFLQLDVGAAPAGGMSGWLAGQLRLAISDGRLPVGSRLPATRVLAGELGVSRGVVTEAYRRLIEDGQAAGRGRGGTIVMAAPVVVPDAVRRPAPACRAGARHTCSPPTRARESSTCCGLLPRGSTCRPACPTWPRFRGPPGCARSGTVLGELSPAEFRYGDPRGAPAFRRRRCELAGPQPGNPGRPGRGDHRGRRCPGARAARPGAPGGRDPPGRRGGSGLARNPPAAGSWELDTPPVPVDASGLRVGDLRASGAPAALLTPAHQFPTGVVLDGAPPPRAHSLGQRRRADHRG